MAHRPLARGPDRHRIAVAVLIAACLALIATTAALAGKDDPLSFDRQRMKIVLDNVAKTIEKNYYDEKLKGLDWQGLKKQAGSQIDAAASVGEMMGAIFGFVSKLNDSHTSFIPPPWRLQPEFGFDARPVADDVRISRIKKGGPAEAAGLLPGDRLLAVNGYKVERATFFAMMIAFRRLNPQPKLDVTFQRGSEEPKSVQVVAKPRELAQVEDLSSDEPFWRCENEAEAYAHDNPALYRKPDADGIGYVFLPEFYATAQAGDDVDHLLGKVKDARALIVDLRGNGGGAIAFLQRFAGHFVTEDAKLFDAVSRGKTEPLIVKSDRPLMPGPLVVLVDGGSASASEVFARWVQLRHRGKVVGDRTRGKLMEARGFGMSVGGGTVTTYGVQVTVADVRFSDGQPIEGVGVTPDEACVPTGDDMREGRDPCLDRAYALLGAKPAAAPAKP